MATFIWTSEYEVFVINRETLKEAKKEFKRLKSNYEDHQEDTDYFEDKLTDEPKYVIQSGESLIFDHANE